MATLYSQDVYNSFTNVHYRTKCDYTITTSDTATTFVVSYSIQLQSYGLCASDNEEGYYTDTSNIEFGQAIARFVGESGIKTTPYAAGYSQDSADWRDLPPTQSGSITFDKGTSAITKSLLVAVLNGSAYDESINANTINITIPALASKNITYNANGGEGAPPTGKKYYGQTYTIPQITPSRPGYEFSHWNTMADNSGTTYNIGSSYVAQEDVCLYAIWNPIIYYDGNGAVITGFGSQTKIYDADLTLYAGVPTRDGYLFQNWNTSANGTGESYQPSDTYTSNSTATLYAKWAALPMPPQISSMTAVRCDEYGDEDDYGEYALITVSWSVDTTSVVYPNNTGIITGRLTPQNGASSPFTFSGDISGVGGTATAIVQADINTQYIVTATVTDLNSSSSRAVILTRAHYIMDFKAGGRGIGIGRVAPDSGLEIGYETQFDNSVLFMDDALLYIDQEATSSERPSDYALLLAIESLEWEDEVLDE